MKTAEKIIGGLVLLGFVLRLFHIPGGSVLLILSANLFALFYMAASYFLFRTDDGFIVVDGFQYKRDNPMRIVGSIATGICLSTTIIGIEFRVMHWPGSLPVLIIGVLSLMAIAAISFFKYRTKGSDFYRKVLFRTSIIGGIGLIMACLAFGSLRGASL